MTGTAKVFETGRSQAVRLPKEFRFSTSEVYIRKEGDNVILTPKPDITWEEFFLETEPCPDFVLNRDDNTEPQERFVKKHFSVIPGLKIADWL